MDEDFTYKLFNKVIELISDEESFIDMNKGDTVPDGGEDSDDFDFEKMKASKKRKKDV